MLDNMFPSNDGRYIYVSRHSFADVVGLDANSGEIVWRTPIEVYRANYVAISPVGFFVFGFLFYSQENYW